MKSKFVCRQHTCAISEVKWAPGFGAQQVLGAGSALTGSTSVSQDDTVAISVKLDCAVATPEYGSVIFSSNGGTAAAFLLKPEKGSMRGSVSMAEVAAQVRCSRLGSTTIA